MPLVDQYLWIAFIGISTVVVIHVRQRLALRGARGAAVALGIANLPWLVQGIATITNPAITIHNIFRASLGWPAYAMIASVVVVWFSCFCWLFVARGAERLAAHPAAVLILPTTANGIKLFFIAAVCGGIVGLITLVITNI